MAVKPVSSKTQYPYVVMRLDPVVKLNADTFFNLAQLNKGLHMELSAEGDLIVMPPTGLGTSIRNSKINARLRRWAEQEGLGEVLESSGGFRLSNGAVRSPDAAWVSKTQLEKLTDEQISKFPPLRPEFILELRSPTDRLEGVKEKMLEYIENGVELGWLIDPLERKVYIYTSQEVAELEQPEEIRGTGVLEGFALELNDIW